MIILHFNVYLSFSDIDECAKKKMVDVPTGV